MAIAMDWFKWTTSAVAVTLCIIECSYLFAVYLSCLVCFLFFFSFFFVAASLKQTLALQLQRLFKKNMNKTCLSYRLLNFIIIWYPGWKCRLRSLSKRYKKKKWNMFTKRCHVVFWLICHVKLLGSIGLVL